MADIENLSFVQTERYVRDLLFRNEFSRDNTIAGDAPSVPGSFSPKAYITYLDNVLDEMGRGSKGIQFIISQTALHVLNPTFGQGVIWNPIVAVGGPPPLLTNFLANSLDVFTAVSNPVTDNVGKTDKLIDMYNGELTEVKITPGIPPVDIEQSLILRDGTTLPQKQLELNFADDKNTFNTFNLIDLEDGRANQRVVEPVPDVQTFTPDFEKMFNKYDKGPAFLQPATGKDFFKPNKDAIIPLSDKYIRATKAMSNFDTFFNSFDAQNGFVNDDNFIIDDDAYVPFYFEDFRMPGRYIFFRAFITNIGESIQPEWNVEKYYGRVDPVATYQNTMRTINVSFKIVAMSQVGLTTMWKKINNMAKLMLPTFENGVLKSSPVCRLRIGDVISDGNGLGLPGFITSWDADYSPYPWDTTTFPGRETEAGKAPMGADISFGFQVVHEQQPSVDQDYNFDNVPFRRIGTLVEDQNNILGRLQNQIPGDSEE